MKLKLVLCLAALAATGCGSDEAEPESAASPAATAAGATMPAAEWSTTVEEICDKNANEAEAEGARIAQEAQENGVPEGEMVAQVLERGIELTEPLLDEVAALPLPQGNERQAKEFDQRMRDLMPVVQDMADTARDEDSTQAEFERVTKEMIKQTLPVRALARDLNIHACIPNNSAG